MRLTTLLTLGLLTACGADDTDDTGATGTEFDDGELAADLWTAIAGYESWGRPAGWSDVPVESGDHMGSFVVRFDSADLLAWDYTGEAPAGAISVKEQYAADGTTLESLTVMQKVPGYDPDNGDWFWAMYMPDGMVGEAGQVEMCSGCHVAVADTDYVHQDAPGAR